MYFKNNYYVSSFLQPASARGQGIKVIHRWDQLSSARPLVVQEYKNNPYLISGTKFDIRMYVLITSFDPLKIYLYEDGLVRFASSKCFFFLTLAGTLSNNIITFLDVAPIFIYSHFLNELF